MKPTVQNSNLIIKVGEDILVTGTGRLTVQYQVPGLSKPGLPGSMSCLSPFSLPPGIGCCLRACVMWWMCHVSRPSRCSLVAG